MDQQELQNKIAEYYEKLPESVQVKLSSMGWLEDLKAISTKYNLSDSQVETLGTETTLALLGILHLGEYAQILANELKLEDAKLTELLTEIDEKIFKEIAPELAETFEKNNQPEEQLKEEVDVSPTLKAKLSKLPEEVQRALSGIDYESTIYQIAKSYNFTITETDVIEKATTGIITGELATDKFESILKEKLKTTDDKVKSLIQDINEKILKVVRSNMMSGGKKEEVKKEEPPSPESLSKGHEILKQAGIEVLENTLELKAGPLAESKLSEPFKIPSKKTEYTLENISKSTQTKEETKTPESKITPPVKEPTPKTPTSYGGQDPYRMPIE